MMCLRLHGYRNCVYTHTHTHTHTQDVCLASCTLSSISIFEVVEVTAGRFQLSKGECSDRVLLGWPLRCFVCRVLLQQRLEKTLVRRTRRLTWTWACNNF